MISISSGAIVENFLVFWVNEISENVEVLLTDGELPSTTSTTVAPPSDEFDIYEGCGVSKTCFGIGPGDCVQNRACVTFGAVIYRDDKFIFEIRSTSELNLDFESELYSLTYYYSWCSLCRSCTVL